MASVHREANQAKRKARQRGKHRAQPAHKHQMAAWLGASAITLGMGAALVAGAAETRAESGTADPSASSSPDNGPSKDSEDTADNTATASTDSELTSESVDSGPQPDAAEEADETVTDSDDAAVGDVTDANQSSVDEEGVEEAEDETVQTLTVSVEESVQPGRSDQVVEAVVEEPEPPVTPVVPISLVVTQAVVNAGPVARLTAVPTTLASVVAAVTSGTAPYPTDPGWDAYVDRLLAADPNGLFLTRAAFDYLKRAWTGPYPLPIPESQLPQAYQAQAAVLGTKGFALNSQGSLVFANTESSDLGLYWFDTYDVLTNPLPNGFALVRPGESYTLPAPSQGAGFAYALFQPGKQAPGRPDTFAGIAWVGQAPFVVGGPTTPAENPLIAQLRALVNQIIARNIAFLNRVVETVQTIVRNVVQVVDRVVQEAKWQTQESAPSGAGALHNRLRELTAGDKDGVVVQQVQIGFKGEMRYIVYINGTEPGTDQSIIKNSDAYRNIVKSTQVAAIRQAISESGGVPTADGSKVMIVGYSQGGMDAQNIALKSGFNVTAVVTYGSPVVVEPSLRYKTIHIGAVGDPVPQLSKGDALVTARRYDQVFGVRTATYSKYLSNIFDPFFPEWRLHADRETYNQAGTSFTFNTQTKYLPVKSEMKGYQGKVVKTLR